MHPYNIRRISFPEIPEIDRDAVVTGYPGLVGESIWCAVQVLRRILSSSEQEFRSRAFILESMREFGFSFCDRSEKVMSATLTASSFGAKQIPSEFCDVMIELCRLEIEAVADIRVGNGVAAFFAAAMLQRANRGLVYTLVDIEDHLIGFDVFSKFLRMERLIPATSIDIVGREFDCIFIDADHSYQGVRTDYEICMRLARKAVVFNEIYGHELDGLNGEVVRAWNEIKYENAAKFRIAEYAHHPDRWMGFGFIDKTGQ